MLLKSSQTSLRVAAQNRHKQACELLLKIVTTKPASCCSKSSEASPQIAAQIITNKPANHGSIITNKAANCGSDQRTQTSPRIVVQIVTNKPANPTLIITNKPVNAAQIVTNSPANPVQIVTNKSVNCDSDQYKQASKLRLSLTTQINSIEVETAKVQKDEQDQVRVRESSAR